MTGLSRQNPGREPAGVYIHVPFCEKKCAYCDFYSLENHDRTADFLDAVGREAAGTAGIAAGMDIRTVYFGGGTPSVLPVAGLERILAAVHRSCTVRPDAEITIEVNPGTITRSYLQDLRSAGFNRLSIGVQSFDPQALAFLGRIHSADDARRAIADARAAGFRNLSIDLIYAVPGQADADWDATLDEAVRTGPEHISAYSLIVEEQTPLFTRVQQGLVRPHDDAHEAALYERTMAVLEDAGYEHYEVSNYARPGMHSRHNSAYWDHTSYIGLGPSAHSFLRPAPGRPARRWSNVRSIGAYCDGAMTGGRTVDREEDLSAAELFEEGVFLGLRSGGLDEAAVEALSGIRFTARQRSTLAGLCETGLAERVGERVRLTRAGFMLCDEVCARMLVP